MNILITGCAGFIGFSLSKKILDLYPKNKIIGLDNLNDFYSIKLKKKDCQFYKNIKILNFIK